MREAKVAYEYKPGWVRCVLRIGKEELRTGWYAKPDVAYEKAKKLAESVSARIVEVDWE